MTVCRHAGTHHDAAGNVVCDTCTALAGTAPPPPSPPKRKYKTECYAVAVDGTWFLSKDDWTESPAFAVKYSRPRVAAGRAQDEQEKHPTRHIRVVRLRQIFFVEEIV